MAFAQLTYRESLRDIECCLLIPEPGAIYVMDRAYLDFQQLYQMHQNLAVFVMRSKTNTGLRRLYSHVDRK